MCALTTTLPHRDRAPIVAAGAIAYATVNFAMTLRFNPGLLGIQGLPVIVAMARTAALYVVMACLVAMIVVVVTTLVEWVHDTALAVVVRSGTRR